MQFTFAELLRSYRERASLDQAALAAALGVHRNTIGRWEQGEYRPRYREQVLRLADELALTGAETDQLLRAADFPPASGGAALPAARHQLRAPVADFVGRERETASLVTALRAAHAQGAGAVIGGVQGMGGVGKTELAYYVAHQLRGTYPDAQLLVDLHGSSAAPLAPAQALAAVIRVFSPDANLPDDVPALQQLYQSVLHGRRVLVLADDAYDATQVRPLMPPAGCALLITSRLRFALPGIEVIALEPLGEAAAVRLLRRICDRLSIGHAQAMARACGQLPLALRISGGIVRNDIARPVALYLQQLVDQRQRLNQLRDPDDPQLDVEASLSLSYAQLDPAARLVFRRLGVLVNDFTTALAVAVVAPEPSLDVEAVLHRLLRRNLILYDLARERWRLHDLVRDLAQCYLALAGELEATQWRGAHAAVRIAEEIRDLYLAAGDGIHMALARFDAERPHIDAARRWATSHAGTAESDALLLADALATCSFGGLRYNARRERLPQTETALSAARRLGDRHGAGVMLNQLGRIHHFLGNASQAITYYEAALAIAQETADRSGEANALNNLGMAYAELGDIPCAGSYFEQRLAIAQDQGESFGQGSGLCNLGILAMLLGDARKALAYFEPALAHFRTIGNQGGEAAVLGNLGSVYLELGDVRRALTYFEPALAHFRTIGNQGGEARFLTELGRAYTILGDTTRAIETCASACTLFQEIGAQREEGYALRALAAGYAAHGDTPRARATFEAALACLDAAGDRHGTAGCRWEFGCILAGWGERECALPLLRAALAYERTIGHVKASEHAALLARVELEATVPVFNYFTVPEKGGV